MPERHLILCGGIDGTKRSGVKVHRLRLGKGSGEISLDVGAITEKMLQKLPPVMHDLLKIATYVYVADQAISRGGVKSFDYAEKWNRDICFEIPVQEIDLWSNDEIKSLLEETLSFVSGDTYTFNFVKRPPSPFPEFLNFKADAEPDYKFDEVVLFSGGLDSFTGAVDEVIANNKCPVLVSHQSNNKMVSLQCRLYDYLAGLRPLGLKPLHVHVMINKDKRLTRDTNQRTRSFLFATLGAVVANAFSLKRVKFYENGVTSCNLSWDFGGPTWQARATRVTHPKFMNLLSNLVSALIDDDFCFENPYFSKTKTEVCLKLKELHHEPYISETRSCAKSVYHKPQTHCGTCSQCIDRRFATLAAECAEYDPDWLYVLNIFTDNLDSIHDRAMAAGFAGFATRLEKMSIDDFVTKYSSEVYEIAKYIPSVNRDEAMRAIFNLHYRHAQKVNSVLDTAIGEQIAPIRKGILPDTCLLSMVARKEHLNIGRLLAKRAKAGKKHAKEELNKDVAKLLELNPARTASEIAERIENTSASSVRQTQAWKNRRKNR